MTGTPGVINMVAAEAVPHGKVKGTALRCMTMAAAVRAVLLMTLMAEAGYGEVLQALFGDLALLPWHVPFGVPTGTVLATWRDAAGPEPLLRLRDMVLAVSHAEHEEHGYRAIEVGDLRLGSIDGSVTRMADTPANRGEFGSAGTADDSAPYPQLRDLPVTDASTRGMLAVVTGPSGGDKAAAEQALLDRALTEFAWVFTKGRLFVMDRNFPGTARIARMIKVTHVLIRLKSDIRVTKIGGFLPDGSYMADICGSGQTVRMRVIEYYVHVDGQDVPEMFCLVTDLDDWQAHPAGMLAAAYKWRWDGSETALREAKSAIRGAGPSTGRSSGRSPRPWSARSTPPGSPPASWSAPWPARRRAWPPRPARAGAPGSPSSPGRSPSPPPAAPPSPPSATAPPPPACPPRSPPPGARKPSATWGSAASSSTGTGTAHARPRPARHSPPPGAAPRPARPPPASPSAAPSPPEHQPRQHPRR